MLHVLKVICELYKREIIDWSLLNPPIVTRPGHDDNTNHCHDPNDTKERRQIHLINAPKRHRDVHPEDETDQMEGHEDGRQQHDLAEHLVGGGPLVEAVDGDGREVVAVGAGEDILEMAEVGHHGDDVVLDVVEVHADVHARGDDVVLVAALREAAEHVGLATEETQQGDDVVPDLADAEEEGGRVEVSHDEDVVLEGVHVVLDLPDDWPKLIHNIIARRGERDATSNRWESGTYMRA